MFTTDELTAISFMCDALDKTTAFLAQFGVRQSAQDKIVMLTLRSKAEAEVARLADEAKKKDAEKKKA